MRHKILIIDDDTSLAEMLALHYEDQDYYADICNSLSQTAEKNLSNYDVILLDHHLTDGLGLTFLKSLKGKNINTPVIMMTGKHDMDLAIEALRFGALDYVHKPLDMDSLDTLIASHIKSQNINQQEDIIHLTPINPHNLTPKIAGSHPSILEPIKKIALASNNASSVIIYGEQGTGKTLASQVIHHYFSDDLPYTYIQAGSPFSIPKFAKFIIIDHIEKLSKKDQTELLSWLLHNEHSAVKVISTSKLTPEELKTTLSEGLQQKLFDTKIHMPTLRERKSDIPALSIHIVSQLIFTLNSTVKGIEKNALNFLEQQDWHGNISELHSLLSFALQDTKMPVLDLGTLQLAAQTMPAKVKTERAQQPDSHNLQNMEEQIIYDTLLKNNGHKSNSASELGISRPALDRKIAKYDIDVQKIKQQNPA